MNWIKFSVDHPVSTIVGVLLLSLFSLVAVFSMPIQMKPNMDRPIIRIQTVYPGAAPPEVEQQITDKLEEQISSVEGLRKLSSTSRDSLSQIEMEFEWGVDRDARFVDVLQKVSQVPNLPIESEKPILSAVSSEDEDRIMWIGLRSKTLSTEEMTYFAKKEIKDALERVDGVGDVMIFGTREREIWVILDPGAMSGRGLSVAQVRTAILQENQNIRGGYLDEGKTRFNVRTIGQFDNIETMRRIVISRDEQGPVYLEDIAEVKDTFEKITSITRGDTEPMIAMGVSRKTGANVIDVTKKLEKTIIELNERYANIFYHGRPADMRLIIAFKESDYIWDSLDFVISNLWQGALLAVIVLMIFLKNIRATLVVSIVIPICFVSNFLFLWLLDRSLNIISLAGIAFAVGMTVDNAIVVVENIYRHLEMGKTKQQAVLDGTTEVWGAVLASTLTTVAVFIPILYVTDEAGELFRDIALAISISVSVSLIVALTVIPMMSSRMLSLNKSKSFFQSIVSFVFLIPNLFGTISCIVLRFFLVLATGVYFPNYIKSLASVFVIAVKIAIVATILVGALIVAWIFTPPLEYLPNGNQNFVIVIFKLHPGTNLEKGSEILAGMEQKIFTTLLDPTQGDTPENRVIDNMFAVTSTEFNVIGVILKRKYILMPIEELPPLPDFQHPGEMLPPGINPMTGQKFASTVDYLAFQMAMPIYGTPGTEFAFAFKPGIFTFQGKSFTIELRGPNLEELEQATKKLKHKLEMMSQDPENPSGFTQITQDFQLGLPEIQVKVDREKAAAFGLSTIQVAEVVETMIAGSKTGKFRDGADEYDVMVRGNEQLVNNIEDLKQMTFMVPGRGSTTLENIADIYIASGPTEIYHKERVRAITLQVNLDDSKPLSEALESVAPLIADTQEQLRKKGNYEVRTTGTASDLQRTLSAFTMAFILSIIVTYLLMASLFESFFYPLIIMFSVPLAISGSLFAIYYNEVPMDMLTLLGFIILCGIVVNNAILVVYQTINFIQEGMERQKAIVESSMTRLRPIFMSSLTTIFGLLPMCLKGSPGSELYSGLGTAIAGGLTVSTIFTLFLTPALLSFWFDIQDIGTMLKNYIFGPPSQPPTQDTTKDFQDSDISATADISNPSVLNNSAAELRPEDNAPKPFSSENPLVIPLPSSASASGAGVAPSDTLPRHGGLPVTSQLDISKQPRKIITRGVPKPNELSGQPDVSDSASLPDLPDPTDMP